MSLRVVVVLSDTHFGSTVGLWPPGFTSQEGVPIGQNDFQQWLWECWTDLHEVELPRLIGDEPYALVLNGDSIEGIHHNTLQVMTPNPTDQMTAAKMALAPVAARAAAKFVIKGTEAHTRDREISLGEAINAVEDAATGQRAFDKLSLDVHGCRTVFRHHMPTSMRPNLEGTAMSNELGSERIEAARSGHAIPRVLCMAHRHRHGIFRDSSGLVCVTAGWQGLTRHGYKVVGAGVPSPSCIVLDWRGKERGGLPAAEDFVYIPRQAEAIAL